MASLEESCGINLEYLMPHPSSRYTKEKNRGGVYITIDLDLYLEGAIKVYKRRKDLGTYLKALVEVFVTYDLYFHAAVNFGDTSKFIDPCFNPELWNNWHDFEEKCGNDYSPRTSR